MTSITTPESVAVEAPGPGDSRKDTVPVEMQEAGILDKRIAVENPWGAQCLDVLPGAAADATQNVAKQIGQSRNVFFGKHGIMVARHLMRFESAPRKIAPSQSGIL